MQKIETGKKNLNELLNNYGPLGPRHLLAAAMLMRPRAKDDTGEKEQEKKSGKVAA